MNALGSVLSGTKLARVNYYSTLTAQAFCRVDFLVKVSLSCGDALPHDCYNQFQPCLGVYWIRLAKTVRKLDI